MLQKLFLLICILCLVIDSIDGRVCKHKHRGRCYKYSHKSSDDKDPPKVAQVKKAARPPHIFKHPKASIIYLKRPNLVQLPCSASGYPAPSYGWTVNGKDLNESTYIRHSLPTTGNLRLNVFRKYGLDGIYQCHAVNEHGTALSPNTRLVYAVLEDFVQEGDANYVEVTGTSLSLPCKAPKSVPAGEIYWIQKTGDGTERNVTNIFPPNEVVMGLDGSLNFKALKKDHGNYLNDPYICVVTNKFLEKRVLGRMHFLDIKGDPTNHSVSVMSSSPNEIKVVRGNTVKLQCIFAGNPIPVTSWERIDGTMPSKAVISADQSTLTIPMINVNDTRTGYICTGSNSLSTNISLNFTLLYNEITTKASELTGFTVGVVNGEKLLLKQVAFIYNVQVETAVNEFINYLETIPGPKFLLAHNERPKWRMRLVNQRRSLGDTAYFNCAAKGIPRVEYTWYINGIEYKDVRDRRIYRNPRVTMTLSRANNAKLTITNITKDDFMNIACNASNEYGSLWADIYLAVKDSSTSYSETVMLANSVGLLAVAAYTLSFIS